MTIKMRKQQQERLDKLSAAADRKIAHDNRVAVDLGYSDAREAFCDIGKEFIKITRNHKDFPLYSINNEMALRNRNEKK